MEKKAQGPPRRNAVRKAVRGTRTEKLIVRAREQVGTDHLRLYVEAIRNLETRR